MILLRFQLTSVKIDCSKKLILRTMALKKLQKICSEILEQQDNILSNNSVKGIFWL